MTASCVVLDWLGSAGQQRLAAASRRSGDGVTMEREARRQHGRRCRLCHEELSRSTESLMTIPKLCTRCHSACNQILRWQQLGTHSQARVVVDVLHRDQQPDA